MNWKFWKRQSTRSNSINEDRTFVPLGSGGAQYSSVYSPPVARCIALYHDFLLNCPLTAKDENDSLFKLLTQRPCSFMSRANFFRLIIERYFIFNGFYSIIDADGSGMITDLLPYASPMAIQVYGNNFKKRDINDSIGDYGDPVKLKRSGFYFRDYKSRTFTEDQLFIVRSSAFNTSTGLVEQEDMAQRVFNNTYESAAKLEAVLNSLCSRDLRPPLLLSGMGMDVGQDMPASQEETQNVKESLRKYFDNQSQGEKGVLALPAGYDIKSMSMDNPSNVLMVVNEVVTANICNIFNVPRSLVFSGANERDTKEARRIFIAGGFKSFCTILTDEFNRLSGYKNKFKYDLDQLRVQMADLREESALAQLAGVLSPQEIKNKIEQY